MENYTLNLLFKTLIGMGLFVTIDIFLNALCPHISFVIVALFMVFVNIHVTF